MNITSDDILMSYDETDDMVVCKLCGHRQRRGYGIPWEHNLTECLEACFSKVELSEMEEMDRRD